MVRWTCFVAVLVAVLVASSARAAPSASAIVDLAAEDSEIVESTIRETRAAKDAVVAPANFYHTYDSGDKGDKGYTRSKQDQGKNGYQVFDSFHKKGGDSYGYEKHDSYGHGDHAGVGHYTSAASAGGAKNKRASAKKGKKSSNEGQSAKYQADPEVYNQRYEVNEEHDEADDDDESDEGDEYDDEGDEGVSEEEAKIAQSGYDEEDAKNYENPTGYYYGSGDEYDF